MQERLTDPPKRNHHGFDIFPPSSNTDYDVVNERFPQLLDEKKLSKKASQHISVGPGKKWRRNVDGRHETKAGQNVGNSCVCRRSD